MNIFLIQDPSSLSSPTYNTNITNRQRICWSFSHLSGKWSHQTAKPQMLAFQCYIFLHLPLEHRFRLAGHILSIIISSVVHFDTSPYPVISYSLYLVNPPPDNRFRRHISGPSIFPYIHPNNCVLVYRWKIAHFPSCPALLIIDIITI